jgi:uncharacterized MAPEG superfamily protein
MTTPSPELLYTALTAAFTGLIWLPVVADRFGELGLWGTLDNPPRDMRPRADWAWRLANAHRNAVENLVVFAPLAIIVHVAGLGSPLTATAAAVFLYARIAHAVVYAFGAPVLRTIAFTAGFVCQAILAARIFGWI